MDPHLSLASSLRFDLWKSLDALTHTKSERWKFKDSEKKLEKILKLSDSKHPSFYLNSHFIHTFPKTINSQINAHIENFDSSANPIPLNNSNCDLITPTDLHKSKMDKLSSTLDNPPTIDISTSTYPDTHMNSLIIYQNVDSTVDLNHCSINLDSPYANANVLNTSMKSHNTSTQEAQNTTQVINTT